MKFSVFVISFLLIVSNTAFSQGLIKIVKPNSVQRTNNSSSFGSPSVFKSSKKKKQPRYWIIPSNKIHSCSWEPKLESVACSVTATNAGSFGYRPLRTFEIEIDASKSEQFIRKILDVNRTEMMIITTNSVSAE